MISPEATKIKALRRIIPVADGAPTDYETVVIDGIGSAHFANRILDAESAQQLHFAVVVEPVGVVVMPNIGPPARVRRVNERDATDLAEVVDAIRVARIAGRKGGDLRVLVRLPIEGRII